MAVQFAVIHLFVSRHAGNISHATDVALLSLPHMQHRLWHVLLLMCGVAL